jgi:hypothetical protein
MLARGLHLPSLQTIRPRRRAVADLGRLIQGFEPETDVERRLADDPALIAGLIWGEPRPGHPEGPVGAHVTDLLGKIDQCGETGDRRRELRFLVLVHDAFKNRVHEWLPKSGANHHAARARHFAERFTDDERLLATLEHHDRPYGLWRKMRRKGQLDRDAFDHMMAHIPDPELFLRFVELDGSTDGKDPEPINWFREELRRSGVVAQRHAA